MYVFRFWSVFLLDYSLLLVQSDIYSKIIMEPSDLRNQLILKQTEMNLSNDADKKRKLATDIQIINHKLSIERIKQLIISLEKS